MECVICGKTIEKSLFSNKPLCSSTCYHINYWNEIIEEKDEHIIIDGVCYYDDGEVNNPTKYAFLGHSGRRFWIRFLDGRTITTNNLWYNGKIPDEFRDQLPDNAEFYTPEHIKFANSLI